MHLEMIVTRRSFDPIYEGSVWKSLIEHVLRAKGSIVIYCGAGTTIDQTGRGWSDLLGNAYLPDDPPKRYPTKHEMNLLQKSLSPEAFASIMSKNWEQTFPDTQTSEDAFHRKLADCLYNDAIWSSGRLARSVAKLALVTGTEECPVHVITTNYETYLLDEYKNILGNEEMSDDDVSSVNHHLKWKDSHPIVHFTFLHGKIRKNGSSEGKIIMSEDDYFDNFDNELRYLVGEFSECSLLLIVGASLTDAPLLRALHETANSKNKRFAILLSNNYEDSIDPEFPKNQTDERVRHQLSHRGDAFHLEILVPDFKMQVAQVIEECALARQIQESSSTSNYGSVSYRNRLVQWEKTWQATNAAETSEKKRDLFAEMSRNLHIAVNEIRGVVNRCRYDLSPSEQRAWDSERLRLELWIRSRPTKDRTLTLWNTSTGPIFDRTNLNQKEIEIYSQNAAIRCFTEGRALHLDLSDLVGSNAWSGRWRSFITVPVFNQLLEDHYPEIKSSTPIGVLVLASNKNLDESVFPINPRTMKEIVDLIMTYGTLQLSPSDDESARTI